MVSLKNCKWSELENRIKDKNVYCFGSGNLLQWLDKEICGYSCIDYIRGVIDNDDRKDGTEVQVGNAVLLVMNFDNFLKKYDKDTIVIITSSYYFEMLEQLDNEVLLDGMECYIEIFLEEKKIRPKEMLSGMMKIPKKIHYCWFGTNPIPEEYENYIATWKKYCPDYEIVRWDESNYDYKKHTYMSQAYEAGKYAFVSDYARLDVIYNNGGIYLDTDVEVIKKLDNLLNCEMFCGFEQGNVINTGLGFGAVKGFEVLKKMRDMYDDIAFVKEDGSLNLTACPYYQTEIMKELGFLQDGTHQIINEIQVLPRTCLAPLDYYGVYENFSEYTYTIHHYSASWMKEKRNREYWKKKNEQIRRRSL